MYAILRTEKAKSLAAIGTKAAHNLRKHAEAAPHADKGKKHLNRVIIGPKNADDVTDEFRRRLDSLPKFRKDAVQCIEFVMTASPDFFKKSTPAQQKAWLDGSIEWLKKTVGQDNIVSLVAHMDESSPHLQALVIPVFDGKLRAAHILDGPAKMKALQTGYYKHVRDAGLERGIEGSKSTHVKLRDFYKLVEKIVAIVTKAPAKLKIPELPERDWMGRVDKSEWEELQSNFKTYGAEVLKINAAAVAGRVLAASRPGEEEAKRRKEAERRLAEAKAEAEAALKRRDALLSEVNELGPRLRQMQELHADVHKQIEAKQRALRLGELNNYAEERKKEISGLIKTKIELEEAISERLFYAKHPEAAEQNEAENGYMKYRNEPNF
jgi:hypothetical protein